MTSMTFWQSPRALRKPLWRILNDFCRSSTIRSIMKWTKNMAILAKKFQTVNLAIHFVNSRILEYKMPLTATWCQSRTNIRWLYCVLGFSSLHQRNIFWNHHKEFRSMRLPLPRLAMTLVHIFLTFRLQLVSSLFQILKTWHYPEGCLSIVLTWDNSLLLSNSQHFWLVLLLKKLGKFVLVWNA